MQCCEDHKTELFALKCVGTNVWPDYCKDGPPGPSPGPTPPPAPPGIVNDTDCFMRSLFVEYAAAVNPNVDGVKAQAMIDALAGDPLIGAGCNIRKPAWTVLRANAESSGAARRAAAATTAAYRGENADAKATVQFFVDAANGNDLHNAGTEAAPFKTVQRGVNAVRAASGRGSSAGGTVTLRAGVYRFTSALMLTPADNGLVIETHAADTGLAWLSGAAPLANVTWKPVNVTHGANIWSADLSATGIAEVESLRWQGRRLCTQLPATPLNAVYLVPV